MRKTVLSVAAAVICVSVLSGCQKAPEASDNGGILHAQSALDQQIADITGENAEEGAQQQSGVYEGTIGTAENKMHISAQIPDIPESVYEITIVPNDDIDKDALTALLDSSGGNIEDTSQELLDEIEKSDYENTHGDELFFYSKFSDHSAMRFTDGEREVSFTGHTSVGYVDCDLRDTYFENIHAETKDDENATRIPVGQPDTGTGFSVKEAEGILLDKLAPLGITEVVLSRIMFMDGNGYSYYDLNFVPSYEGMAMISEVDVWEFGEIYPNGFACVTPEGVADFSLSSFCGKIADKESVRILSFAQVEQILGQYLDSNMIQADEKLTFSEVRLEYYPVPNPAPAYGEIEYRSKLELIPIWHIYMPLDDYIDMRYQGDGLDSAAHNICINAVTGEIEKIF